MKHAAILSTPSTRPLYVLSTSSHLAPDVQDLVRGLDPSQAEQTVYDVPELGGVDGAASILVKHVEYPVQLVLQSLELNITSWLNF